MFWVKAVDIGQTPKTRIFSQDFEGLGPRDTCCIWLSTYIHARTQYLRVFPNPSSTSFGCHFLPLKHQAQPRFSAPWEGHLPPMRLVRGPAGAFNSWVFPKTRGTKSSIFMGFSFINHPFVETLIYRIYSYFSGKPDCLNPGMEGDSLFLSQSDAPSMVLWAAKSCN